MKKTAIAKVIFAAILVLLTLTFVTCDDLLTGIIPKDGGDDDDSYTDVEYEIVGGKGNERVKSVTLYLRPDSVDKDAEPGPDTYGVKRSAEQRRIERALSLEGARMSHDYFEAVFYATNTAIARAAWEIGQPAGISGVPRNGGHNYTGVNPASATPGANPTAASAIIFVGKKTGRTLLGVGYLTHIDDKVTTTGIILDESYSVTFTVSPLATWLGLIEVPATTSPAAPAYWWPNQDRTDIAGTTIATSMSTFEVAYMGAVSTTGYATPTRATTRGEIISPRGTGAKFPLYYLPSVKNKHATVSTSPFTVEASYKIGGLTAATVDTASTSIHNGVFPGGDGLTTAVRIWGSRATGANGQWTAGDPDADPIVPPTTASTNLKGGLQFIKRTPAFMVSGLNYEINDSYHDKITQITDLTPTQAALVAPDAAFPTAGLPVRFQMYWEGRTSGGIFAITFQVPVYALTIRAATNAGSLPPEKWWIRPDYSQYQYLLDNGIDSGGAVLLGTDVEGGGGDWIQINTIGIGFDNE